MSAQGSGAERQVVVFHLADEQYALPIEVVHEIIRAETDITAVPGAAAAIRGVINLRGRIIPVMDLRRRFGLVDADQTKESRIIIADAGTTRIGIIVDAVTEVLMLPADSIEPAPELAGANASHVEGISKLADRLVILLAIEALVADGGYGL